VSMQISDQIVFHSPPPCGEALGVGVSNRHIFCGLPPSLTLPHKGGGNDVVMRV